MKVDVEEYEPDDMVREGHLQQPLEGEGPVHAVEGDEAVDDHGHDPLLGEGEQPLQGRDD